MKDFILLVVAIVIWVVVWRFTARYLRRKNWNALGSHLTGATSGIILAIVFLSVLGPDEQIEESDAEIVRALASNMASSTNHATTVNVPTAQTPVSANIAASKQANEDLPDSVRKINNSWFGCKSDKLLAKITDYSAARDKIAFENTLRAGIANGECTFFSANETVQLMDTALFRGFVRLRKFGDTTEYWTNIKVINK